jgi:hypothetical protein
MSDTYFIREIECAYCGKINNFENVDEFSIGLPYDFEFGQEFICKYCNKENKVVMEFVAVKIKSKKKKRGPRFPLS